MAQRALLFTLMVLLLVSAQAARPVRSNVAALAAVYAADPIEDGNLVTGRHLQQKAKPTSPNRPKSVKSADTATRSFARLNPKTTTKSGRRFE